MADDAADSGADTFAAKLRRLFEVARKPAEDGGGPYSVPEVAAALGVSKQHMYDLLSGKKHRPAWDLVRAIAEFFDVSVIYFDSGEEAERYSQQLELLAALGNAGVRDIALRSGQLSPEHRDVLMGLLEVLEEKSNRKK